MRRNSTLAAVATLALIGLPAGAALAASGTASSSVTIRKPITVTKALDMSFGEILPPTAGSQDFILAPATSTLTPGTGDGVRYGTPAAASFNIAGKSNAAISVSAAVTSNFTGTGVTLGSLTTSGDTASIPGGGSGNIKVGGTLSVDSSALDGDRTAAVSLTVNYQ